MAHPLLRSPKQFLVMGLLWSPLCLWVIVIHKNLAAAPWITSTLLVIPPMMVKLFICLSLWYLCKTIKLDRRYRFKLIAIHLLSLAIINAAWLFFILVYSSVLDLLSSRDIWVNLFTASFHIFLGLGVSLYFISVLVYYLVLANEKIRISEQEILKQKLFASQAELNALKTTIHPHFLFNSLNMIVPLVRKSPKGAQAFITQLSDFLLYSLRYGKKQQVTVQDELDHITNYLAIEGERLGERLSVDLNVAETARQQPILPLTLLPLVENAIKHGIGQSLEGGTLSISIKQDPDALVVEIENPYEKPLRSAKGEGMGLETLKKRFNVYYGSAARMMIHQGDSTFNVKLRLPLDNVKNINEKK
ncbi:MAG: histidine kinase [Candidatus Aminicenantes bacterium]|nr:MAG: histidine kinase [Candidatus Aminicenantes bacterium]